MNEHNPLAQEMTAQLQLGLFSTVGKLAKQLRTIDRIAPKLREGGIVRAVKVDRNQQRYAVGVSAASRRIQAFSGLLYGIGSLAHFISASGPDIAHTGQKSRMDVGDMSMLEHKRRLQWKTYRLVYDLLDEIFAADPLPELVILDVPLVMGREVYANAMASDESDELLEEEINALRDRLELFWNKHIDRCFPFAANGPRIVTLRRGRFASLLRLMHEKGSKISPDPISPAAEERVRTEWTKFLSIGVDRLVKGILTPEHRTAAFDYAFDGHDYRAFPKALVERGSMGLHYLTGLRSQPIQVEVLGAAACWADAGGAEALDRLVADLIGLTYFDQKEAWPLPLWYAKQGVEVIKKPGILEFYKREALNTMRQEQVDQSWLIGWESE
jgi:hypothetical protein